MQIASNVKDIIIIVAVGMMLFFGYQGVFGKSGALALMKEQHAVKQAQMELILEQMKSIRAQQQEMMKEVKAVKETQEAARQQIGTVARKVYHPTMKRVRKADAKELVKEVHRYNDLFGLTK
jgi:cell division protein FtsB